MIEEFNKIEDFVKKCINNLGNSIELDDITSYGDKKLEMVLTVDERMISISILLDNTYDLMVVEIESEAVIMSKTKNCDSIDELFQELKDDFEKIVNLTI